MPFAQIAFLAFSKLNSVFFKKTRNGNNNASAVKKRKSWKDEQRFEDNHFL